MTSVYGQVIVYKALAVMSQHPEHYPEYAKWLVHDPYFVLPIVVMAANFNLIKNSEHPFFVNVRRDQNKWVTRLIDSARGIEPKSKVDPTLPRDSRISLIHSVLCLASGVLFIALPQSYSIAYLSYLSTHFAIRAVRRKPCLDTKFAEYLKSL